ncbi:MAG: PH domain-containing protein [Syntrophus sp. (in: bacteria)]
MGLLSGILGNAGVVDAEKLRSDYGQLILDGETIEVGFQVIRDTFVFTNKRLILVDIQGLTGKKIEYLSIPYNKITKFSIETAGTFDLDAELKLWIGSDPAPLEKKFNKKVNIYDLQKVLATHVLNSHR